MVTSCEDFLTYQDKDKIIPNELSHYEELIFGELLTKDLEEVLNNIDVMTDDVSDRVNPTPNQSDPDERFALKEWYIWGEEPQISSAGDEKIDECWEFFYRKILMSNIIEEEINEFDDSGMKFRLLGEVQFVRAMSYYYLVNIYGQPFESIEQSKIALGVPINNETSIRKKSYERETLRTVYDFIEANLTSAGKNLEKGDGKVTKFRPNLDAVRLMLSRIYLYQKNYDAVITVTNDLIRISSASIEGLSNIKKNIDAGGFFFNGANSGVIFSWGLRGRGALSSNSSKKVSYRISEELMSMYIIGDIRPSFLMYYGLLAPNKWPTYGESFFKNNYRIEEAYLNRAEAYAEKGNFEAALSDVNDIRKERFDKVPYEKSTTDKTELIQIVRDERRLELCFEDHRWFDIRRWGLEITHIYRDRNNPVQFETFRLKKGSPNYVLPLPLTEQRLNDVITNFKRENCAVSN